MNTISRGVRNAFRNVTRTISIVIILGLSISLALAMLVAQSAVDRKIESVKSSVANTITISPAGARGFEGGGEPLTSEQAEKVASVSNITSVAQTLQDRVTSDNSNLQSAVEAGSLGRRAEGNSGSTNNNSSQQLSPPMGGQGEGGGQQRSFTPPVTVIGTTNTSRLSSSGGTLTLSSGKSIDASKDENVALVGKTLAEKNSLSVGSTFTLYGETMTVAGIFDAGNTFSNNQVVTSLSTLQRISNQSGQISSLSATVDSVDNLASATSAISNALGSAADVTNQQETLTTAVAPLENIKNITGISLIGAVMAGATILLLTMVMIVRERRREIGILKAIGGSNTKVMGQFMSEATTLTAMATVVGLIGGALLASPITSALVGSSASTQAGVDRGGMGGPGGRFNQLASAVDVRNVTAVVGWEIIVYGIVAALLIAVIGSAVASLLIAKVRPAEVMRAE